MAGPLDALPPPAAAANPLDALPPPADLYPGLSSIPGFSYVKPFLDVAAGAGSGAVQTAAGVYDLLRKIPGADSILPDSTAFHQAIQANTPDTMPAHIGKFLEGLTEYAIPAGKAAEATRGMGLGARALAQAGVGAGVSAAQTGGDPGAMATGAVLGAAPEVAGSVVGGVRDLLANKAPTLANFAESFGGATARQREHITKALATLTKDGIVPPDSALEMQDVVKGKLTDLKAAYQNLDPAVRARTQPVQYIVDQLEKVQQQYTQRGVVVDEARYNAVQNQIDTIQKIAAKIGDNVQVDDLAKMKALANQQTHWDSPDVEKTLWNKIGDAYRNASNAVAPEMTPLNRDEQVYRDLEQMIDKNVSQGKGAIPSGRGPLLTPSTAMGAAAGGAMGHAFGGVPGALVGTAMGGAAGARLGNLAQRAIQNAVDSGAFARMTPIRQGLLRSMQAMGDNAGILKLLGTAATEEAAAGR
jgi:hypothetical protein